MGGIGRMVEGRYEPYVVLVAAILLPGAGHVLLGQARRGLLMQVFMILLAIITWHLTTPAQSRVGRLAGGIFIYAVSIPEAYRLARLRVTQSRSSHVAPNPAEERSDVATARLS